MFYAQGVKANVLFFDNREASPKPWTKEVWYYDYRTNIHHTLKKKPDALRGSDRLRQVLPTRRIDTSARRPGWEAKNPEGRWRKFTHDELIARDKTSLDIFWLKDKSLTDLDSLPEPDDLGRRNYRKS